MTSAEMVLWLRDELKDLSTLLTDDNITNAISDAQGDVGQSLPQTGATVLKWLKERAKRHSYFMLASSVAFKFHFEGAHLNQKFEHMFVLIKHMDAQWALGKEEDVLELSDADDFQFFGTQVDPGFRYEEGTGADLTYGSENEVMYKPDGS